MHFLILLDTLLGGYKDTKFFNMLFYKFYIYCNFFQVCVFSSALKHEK